ncbi:MULTISPECIES: GNAT family N-acetyltransferase [unclassified Nocardiopsis]|uniref:GNAT family N-acetyltransferase n=1 Tax=unclassified Nocardiopsis TaxID=2649073 RepID=UPI0033DE482D
MLIRTAPRSERRTVAELRVRAYEHQGLLSASPSYAHTLRELGWESGDLVLVAEERGRVVGTVVYVPWGPRCEVARGPDEAEVRALAVDPAARRGGVGAALVRAVVDRARTEGVSRLVLCTRTVMTGAQYLYEAQGFVRVPERDWVPVPGVDLLAYELVLKV